MRKKKPQQALNNTPTQPLHPIGRERYISIDVARYEGDLPSGEPNDWFVQSEEFLIGNLWGEMFPPDEQNTNTGG